MANHDDKDTKKQQQILAKFAALDEADINEVVGVLMESAKGQKFLWWLLQIGRVGGQPFTADPLVTAFSCGELNVGQQVLARMIEVNPDGYADLMKKRKMEDDRRSELADASARGDDLFAGDDPADA